jgi:ribonucleoside-diphosphate reductase alpha chain
MQLSEHQRTIFLDRYAKRDQDNKPVETEPEQMWRRVADEIGNNVGEREDFYAILQNFHFVPGGRILAGAGTESEKTYYNCYVIPVETRARRQNRGATANLTPNGKVADAGADSREAIFDTMATMVDIMSRGGGVGINWSVLRPTGSYLARISGTSSGPIGWMDVASKAVGEVIQGGSRRGAAMFMMDDWHPDIEDFINAKRQSGRIENANISVAVSDAFMEAVRNNGQWALRFPDTNDPRYNSDWDGDIKQWESEGGRVNVYRTVNARTLWRSIAASAHVSGEPGIVFLDRYNNQSTANGRERIICVNPCGEQGLGAYSVCNLGSMNLAAYVDDPYLVKLDELDAAQFRWGDFRRDVKTAIRFLDNVIDKTYYHLPETKLQQMQLRRIGLGVMGLADALIMLGMRYGSSSAVAFTERVFRTMKDAAIEASMELAQERGPARAWDNGMWAAPYLAEWVDRHMHTPLTPLRNLFLLTQAPTGTTAALAGVNSGIEPYFSFSYTRKDRTGTHKIVAPIAMKYGKAKSAEEWGKRVDSLVTSNDLTPAQHLIMQAAVQKYVDSSVSKTINAPYDATVESVHEAYTMAYDLGLKGLAYYRDGSRDKQVLYRNDAAPTNGLDTQPIPVIAFQVVKDNVCPVCGAPKVFEEGCQKCSSCSWSAC